MPPAGATIRSRRRLVTRTTNRSRPPSHHHRLMMLHLSPDAAWTAPSNRIMAALPRPPPLHAVHPRTMPMMVATINNRLIAPLSPTTTTNHPSSSVGSSLDNKSSTSFVSSSSSSVDDAPLIACGTRARQSASIGLLQCVCYWSCREWECKGINESRFW